MIKIIVDNKLRLFQPSLRWAFFFVFFLWLYQVMELNDHLIKARFLCSIRARHYKNYIFLIDTLHLITFEVWL